MMNVGGIKVITWFQVGMLALIVAEVAVLTVFGLWISKRP